MTSLIYLGLNLLIFVTMFWDDPCNRFTSWNLILEVFVPVVQVARKFTVSHMNTCIWIWNKIDEITSYGNNNWTHVLDSISAHRLSLRDLIYANSNWCVVRHSCLPCSEKCIYSISSFLFKNTVFFSLMVFNSTMIGT